MQRERSMNTLTQIGGAYFLAIGIGAILLIIGLVSPRR